MAAGLTRKDYISNSIIIQLWVCATSTFLCEIAYDDLLDVNIFIEITPDGNEIRIGINNEYGAYAPTDDNVNATTYDNWQGQKYSSGDAGFGITSVNMMLSTWRRYKRTHRCR